MGESKRKSRKLQTEAAVLQAMAKASVECAGDHPSIQFLLLAADRAEEARQALGGLPERVERALQSLRECATEETGRGCVEWWRSPDGRENTNAMTDAVADVLDAVVMRMILIAVGRGYGLRLANFHSPELLTAWEHKRAANEADLRAVCKEMAEGPPVRMDPGEDGSTELLVPGEREPREWPRLGRELVRHFDRLAATRETFMGSYGRVSVVFDGFHDDPRDIMEIEQTSSIIRAVQDYVPHWRWFLGPKFWWSWTGAGYATSGACVNEAGELSFDVDELAATEGFERGLRDTAHVAVDLGISMSSPEFLGRIREMAHFFGAILATLVERQEALKTGRTRLIAESERRTPSNELESQLSERRIPAMPIVIDRSSIGATGRRMLLASRDEFPPEEVKSALRSWFHGRSELALIRRDEGIGRQWVLEAVEDAGAGLEAAIERMTRAGMARRESVAVTWLVADALQERVAALTARMRDRLVESAPPTSIVITPERAEVLLRALTEAEAGPVGEANETGLLNLAVDPGGTEVDMDRIQITDAGDFGMVAALDLAVMGELMEAHKETVPDLGGMERALRAAVRGWARDDGALVIRSSGRSLAEVIVRPGHWRMLDADELDRLSREAMARMGGREAVAIVAALADTLDKGVQARADYAEKLRAASEATTSITGLFGRSENSLLHLRGNWATREDLIRLADEWLATEYEFFLIWRHREGGVAAAVMADERMLIEEGLQHMMDLGESPGTSILLALTGTSTDAKALQWWTAHGGAVMPSAPDGEVRRH